MANDIEMIDATAAVPELRIIAPDDFVEVPITDRAEYYARQLTLANPKHLTIPITVIGAGAIGSHCSTALAKMGCSNITVYDDDKVTQHNYPNQMFMMHKTLDRPKVEVLQETVWNLAAIKINTHQTKLPLDAALAGIVISGVDRMKTRREIWENVIKLNPEVPLYVDGRMGGQIGQLFWLNPCDPDHIEFYEKNLPPDEETAEDECTARSICYNQWGMAALVSSIVRQHLCERRITIAQQSRMDYQTGLIVPERLYPQAVTDVISAM